VSGLVCGVAASLVGALFALAATSPRSRRRLLIFRGGTRAWSRRRLFRARKCTIALTALRRAAIANKSSGPLRASSPRLAVKSRASAPRRSPYITAVSHGTLLSPGNDATRGKEKRGKNEIRREEIAGNRPFLRKTYARALTLIEIAVTGVRSEEEFN
jgi:hypothetical protein